MSTSPTTSRSSSPLPPILEYSPPSPPLSSDSEGLFDPPCGKLSKFVKELLSSNSNGLVLTRMRELQEEFSSKHVEYGNTPFNKVDLLENLNKSMAKIKQKIELLSRICWFNAKSSVPSEQHLSFFYTKDELKLLKECRTRISSWFHIPSKTEKMFENIYKYGQENQKKNDLFNYVETINQAKNSQELNSFMSGLDFLVKNYNQRDLKLNEFKYLISSLIQQYRSEKNETIGTYIKNMFQDVFSKNAVEYRSCMTDFYEFILMDLENKKEKESYLKHVSLASLDNTAKLAIDEFNKITKILLENLDSGTSFSKDELERISNIVSNTGVTGYSGSKTRKHDVLVSLNDINKLCLHHLAFINKHSEVEEKKE